MRFVVILVTIAFSLFSCGSQDPGRSSSHLSNLPDFSDLEDQKRYPVRPDTALTPGDLCKQASERRYPERIAYCDRNVHVDLKTEVFITYDRELGYATRQMKRQDFKIDHLIPLCMGGSNTKENLWPQYVEIYTLTDPIEPMLCGLLAQGRIKQIEAVELIKEIKQDPGHIEEKIAHLK